MPARVAVTGWPVLVNRKIKECRRNRQTETIPWNKVQLMDFNP